MTEVLRSKCCKQIVIHHSLFMLTRCQLESCLKSSSGKPNTAYLFLIIFLGNACCAPTYSIVLFESSYAFARGKTSSLPSYSADILPFRTSMYGGRTVANGELYHSYFKHCPIFFCCELICYCAFNILEDFNKRIFASEETNEEKEFFISEVRFV